MNSLPKTVTRQRRVATAICLHPGHTAPESSTLTTRLPSHPMTTLRTVFSAVAAVESSSIDVVEGIDGSAVPEQSLDLSTRLTVLQHCLSVMRVKLPQPVVLYPLNLQLISRVPMTNLVKIMFKTSSLSATDVCLVCSVTLSHTHTYTHARTHARTHTRLTALCLGLPR